jgi:hypothetical protein
MQAKRKHSGRSAWFSQLFACAALAALGLIGFGLAGSGLSATPAQAATLSSGSGQYYIEFRSRYAWDYGHTFLIHARVGERVTGANIAGLSPVGDDPKAWVLGHYIPVPSETGATDGDTEEKYVSARYRVYMNKEQYDRTVAFIKHLQATSPTWSAELYNCNAFVGDVARFMGLKVPASSLIYPKIYVTHLRKLNTGHPDAADTLISDNVKEMSNPTRDGRSMINTGIHTVRADPNNHPIGMQPSSSGPRVTIGPVRVSTRAGSSVATEASP